MNASAIGLAMGLREKKAARACLENYLYVLDTNAPINRMEGNFDQARLEAKNAADVRKALHILRQAKVAAAQPGMDPLKATATGAGLGAAMGGALSFGDPGMMGRGALAGGSVGYLASAVDRIVARRRERQRMEKPAGLKAGVRPNVDVAGAAKNIYERAIQNMKQRPKAVATAAGAGLGAVVPGAIGYGLGSALGGLSNISETDPAVARKRRRRFALVGGLIGAAGGALRGAMLMNRPRGFPLPTPAKFGA